FCTGLSACMIVDDARWNLRGRDLAIHRPDGSSEKRALATTHDVLDLLVDTFDIDISGIAGLEARIGAVLDT
ncbi:arylamine N-acetyltransferase, partial [Streptomyces sp. SID10244]|nr:arylamine N-acetyltransferase [Streptomyces sp. SID10244]